MDRFALHRPRPRVGFSITEVVVSASLLASVLTALVPLSFQSARLTKDVRHHRLIVEELSNQIELLSALPADQREKAVAEVEPSAVLLAAIPSIRLTAQTETDKDGGRITVTAHWDRGGRIKPVTLVGWFDGAVQEATP